MSLLNSKFDIVSVDNPVALASLAQVLAVDSPPALGLNGTPAAGVIPPGAIVTMNSSGNAVVATTGDVTAVDPQLVFVTVDGNMDYSGSFVQKLTVLHGGLTIETDQYDAGAYVPNAPVSFNAGKFSFALITNQIIGWVKAYDSVNGVLTVILPQGLTAAKK